MVQTTPHRVPCVQSYKSSLTASQTELRDEQQQSLARFRHSGCRMVALMRYYLPLHNYSLKLDEKKRSTLAVSSTDPSILHFTRCVTTVRALSIFSPGIDYKPVSLWDA